MTSDAIVVARTEKSMLVPDAVTFDLSDWAQIDVTGAKARPFIHNFCTNDINGLKPGRCLEAFFCDIKGRIIGHSQVWSFNEGLRLISVPGAAETLLPHLKKYRLDTAVQFEDRTPQLGLLCLSGPEIPALLESALQVSDLAPGTFQTAQINRAEIIVASTTVVSFPAVLISGPREALENWREQIPDDVLAMGTQELFESQRIAAGYPWVGRDVGPDNIAQEAARTPLAISFDKGCYLGQEPIARLDALGHTNKELRVLRIQSADVQAGAPIFSQDQPAGTLTSVAAAIDPAESFGLGMIKTKYNAPLTALKVRTSSGDVDAVVQ